MGSAASRIGVQRGPSGTAFLGDLRQEAKYGLNLKTHPVQDVLAKTEPVHYIANTLYPKVGSRFLILPRQYVSATLYNLFFYPDLLFIQNFIFFIFYQLDL